MLFFTPYAARMRATPAMIRAHPSFTLFRETIVRTVALARARKLDLAIVLIPSKEEVYRWVLERQPPWSSDPSPSGLGVVLTEICREADVRLLDLKAPLIEESRRRYERTHELLWWRDDDHWNERARGRRRARRGARADDALARPGRRPAPPRGRPRRARPPVPRGLRDRVIGRPP